MYYSAYISHASRLMENEDLIDILIVSRNNNSRKNITGILLYGDGTFVQLLEGEKDVVDKLITVIAADNRHEGVTIISSGTYPERCFAKWSMGFASPDADTFSIISGYTRPESYFVNVDTGGGVSDCILNYLKEFAETHNLQTL